MNSRELPEITSEIHEDNMSMTEVLTFLLYHSRLRKVKMDQRKLMDNANTITDMAKVWFQKSPVKVFVMCNPRFNLQTQNSVYEIVSDMSTRQDAVDERLSSLEDKLQSLQVMNLISY